MLQRLKEKDATDVMVDPSSTNGNTVKHDRIANQSPNSVFVSQHRHFPRQLSSKVPKETAVKLGLYVDSKEKY